MILPGQTLGILGGGQLGRMTAVAAQRLGLRTRCFDPDPDAPAGHTTELVVAPWDDDAALARFAANVDVITVEQEAIPRASLDRLATLRPLFPRPEIVATCADRLAERRFVQGAGLATATWAPLVQPEDREGAIAAVRFPAQLKSLRGGYDGKGQVTVPTADALDACWGELDRRPCLLEQRIDLEREVSVIVARDADGATELLGPVENLHARGILDVSSMPARVGPELAAQARAAALRLAEAFALVGLLTVEFFVARGGALLVNELAPRPHNSGHLTLEGCHTDQFEQLVRAVAGLPLGSFALRGPTAMANLLGDLWQPGPPDWPAALRVPGLRLHLYGKSAARPGRKMGHLTVAGDSLDGAVADVLRARAALR